MTDPLVPLQLVQGAGGGCSVIINTICTINTTTNTISMHHGQIPTCGEQRSNPSESVDHEEPVEVTDEICLEPLPGQLPLALVPVTAAALAAEPAVDEVRVTPTQSGPSSDSSQSYTLSKVTAGENAISENIKIGILQGNTANTAATISDYQLRNLEMTDLNTIIKTKNINYEMAAHLKSRRRFLKNQYNQYIDENNDREESSRLAAVRQRNNSSEHYSLPFMVNEINDLKSRCTWQMNKRMKREVRVIEVEAKQETEQANDARPPPSDDVKIIELNSKKE